MCVCRISSSHQEYRIQMCMFKVAVLWNNGMHSYYRCDAMGIHFCSRNENVLTIYQLFTAHTLTGHALCLFWKQTTHKYYEPRPKKNMKSVSPKFSYARTHTHCIRTVNAPRKEAKEKKKKIKEKQVNKNETVF